MELKVEHIGYLTDSIRDSISIFLTLGYHQVGEVINDDTQRTKLCFIEKNEETPIELVEPYEDNRTMQRMLVKHGNGPYHICYGVDDIDEAYAHFIKNDWMPLFTPVEAPALNDRRICYFYKMEVGYIELVENH